MAFTPADERLHVNREVSNFLELGDARGKHWLETHPDAAEKAQARLAEWSMQAEVEVEASDAEQQQSVAA